MRVRTASAAVIAVATASMSARAEPSNDAAADRGRLSAGAFVGGGFFSDEVELGNSFFDDQVPGSGFLLGLRAGLDLLPSLAPGTAVDPRLGVELEGTMTFSSTGAAGGRDSSFAPVLGWRVHGILELWQHAQVVPFAVLGVGGETVFGDSAFMETPDTDGLTYTGLGARYDLGPDLGLRADARLGLTAGRFDTFAPMLELHAGAFLRFGAGGPEPVARIEVAAPPEPAIPDADGDGIPDAEDRCPREAEIVNGIDDEDGCPEVDSDGDGLLGSRDQCPAAAEDADGFDDDDGCPDLDNDGDGIADAVDACPDEPETANGYEDDDGCPDEVPEQVARFTGTIAGIQFKSGSARIQAASRSTLDEAVEVLKEYPRVRIEISGHTDDRGGREVNMRLSRKRADYVKWYLVDKGIDADRIETVGHGPDRPIADNSFASGRSQNRRIEFRLLSGPAAAEDADDADDAAEEADDAGEEADAAQPSDD